MKTFCTILSLFCILQLPMFAQSGISGRIVDDKTNEPIEFVNVSLLQSDSTFITGCVSDNGGKYNLDNIPSSENYILSVSCIGYNKKEKVINKNSKSLILDDIKLQSSDILLSEATVTGNASIKKIDRDIIIPSASEMKISNNGVNLLQNLQLPRIIINPINNEIGISGGGEVQLRINGILSEISDVIALNPEDIIRIEYLQDPGLRYNNAAAVIDYITKRKASGGNLATNLQNGVAKTGFAEDNISAKVNHKKSEFSFNSHYRHRNLKWTRENIESFHLTNQTIERTEIGEPTKFKESRLNARINYSLVEKDKYFFNAALKYYRNDTPNGFMDRKGAIYTVPKADPLSVYDHTTSLTDAPSLDLYYQHNLKNDQTIVVNVVGTYINSRNTRTYQESKGDEILTDIFSDITGDRYSIIGEGIYEKQFKNSKLTTGLKHSQSNVKNRYVGNTNTRVNMNTADTYVYTEYQIKCKKFNYSLGVGMSRNYYSQGSNNKESYVFRPSLRISYNIDNNTYIRFNSYVSTNPPSLSDLNNVVQTIDSMQIRRGNPNLKTSWYISNTLNAGYKYKILSLDYFFRYSYDKNPIMSETHLEGDKFIQTIDNQKNMQRVQNELKISIKPWKDYLSFSVTPGVTYFRSMGNNYTHNQTNWFVRASFSANYKNVFMGAEYFTRQNWLGGENFSSGERIHLINTGYKRSKWSIMGVVLNPFDKKYTQTSKQLSALTPSASTVSTNNLSPIFLINFSCNINFGRSYESQKKRMTNDDWDSGIMSGGK